MVPTDAVADKSTVPVPVLEFGVVEVIVGVEATVTVALFNATIVLLQELVAKFVIVIVVDPELGKILLMKVPAPAVVTFIVAVFPEALLVPEMLYVTVYIPLGNAVALEVTDTLAVFVEHKGVAIEVPVKLKTGHVHEIMTRPFPPPPADLSILLSAFAPAPAPPGGVPKAPSPLSVEPSAPLTPPVTAAPPVWLLPALPLEPVPALEPPAPPPVKPVPPAPP